MGISRDSMHKRRATGGKKKAWRKKRKMHEFFESACIKFSKAVGGRQNLRLFLQEFYSSMNGLRSVSN